MGSKVRKLCIAQGFTLGVKGLNKYNNQEENSRKQKRNHVDFLSEPYKHHYSVTSLADEPPASLMASVRGPM